MLKSLYRFFSPKFQNVFLDYRVQFAPRYGHGQPPHAQLYDIINAHRDSYAELLHNVLDLATNIQAIKKIGEQNDANQPAWNNNFLPGLDMMMIYTMLATQQPKRYVEVGSGNSTKVAAKAKKDHQLRTQITSIDPHPRAEIDHLADVVIRKPFEAINLADILELEAGDILFIDNSHRILPNSDATVFFMEVLPRLRKGVIIHIHDIYLPYDYPQFMCDRAYSEQYGLAFFLLANPDRYQTLFPCFFVSEDAQLSDIIAPIWEHPNLQNVEKHGGSFWLTVA